MKIKKFLQHSIVYTAYMSQMNVLEKFQQKIEKHSLHFVQALILTTLFFEERDIRPKEFHEVFQIEKSNLSHAFRSLEKKGLIKRSMHPTDARGYIFSLTSPGYKKALLLIKDFDDFQSYFEDKISKKTFEHTIHQMQKIIHIS